MTEAEDRAAKYGEILDSIADFLEMPTGSAKEDILVFLQGEFICRNTVQLELHTACQFLVNAYEKGLANSYVDWADIDDAVELARAAIAMTKPNQKE